MSGVDYIISVVDCIISHMRLVGKNLVNGFSRMLTLSEETGKFYIYTEDVECHRKSSWTLDKETLH